MAYNYDTFDLVEGQSGDILFTLLDENGDPVAKSVITTLTLYDQSNPAIINSRTKESILDVNNGTMGATDGLVTWTLQPADTAISASKTQIVRRIALFEVTWESGTKSFAYEAILRIRNLALRP